MLLGGLPGCSFIFIETVPDDYATRPDFTCTSSGVAPGWDLAGAITGALGGLIALGLVNSLPGVSEGQKTWIPVAFFAPAAVLSVSSIYGIVQIEECQHAKAEAATRPLAITPITATTAAPTACSFDTECSGDQICVAQQCQVPPSQPSAVGSPP